jgi:hypothetical protein
VSAKKLSVPLKPAIEAKQLIGAERRLLGKRGLLIVVTIRFTPR